MNIHTISTCIQLLYQNPIQSDKNTKITKKCTKIQYCTVISAINRHGRIINVPSTTGLPSRKCLFHEQIQIQF